MTPLTKKLLVIAAVLLVVMIGAEQYRTLTAPTMADFTSKTLTGETFRLDEHRGKRPVLLSFYATWCGPCQMEVEHLIELSRDYKDRGLQVVVVTEEAPSVIKAHPVMSKAPFTIITEASELFKKNKIEGIPHSFYFKANGQMREMQGFSEEDMKSLKTEIKQSLGA